MSIPLLQKFLVGTYVVRQHLTGRKRYPLVLMLEPLFRCNLACAGCGKIDYPDEILNQRFRSRTPRGGRRMRRAGGVDRRRRAAAARELPEIVEGIIARKQVRLSVHQRAADGEEARRSSSRTRIFVWSVHLDGDREMHDQVGLPGRRLRHARSRRCQAAKARGFRVNINCTLFDNADARPGRQVLRQRDGASASTASRCRPATPTSARPTRSTSSTAQRTKELFRDIFRHGDGGRKLVVQPVQPVPRFPRRQPAVPLHAVGQSDAQPCSAGSGPAICSAKATPRPSRS